MKTFFSLILISCSIAMYAQEKAFVYYNQLFNEGENYQIANIKGQAQTWEWSGRTLRFSNSSEPANANQEYPECEEWIVLGPFDLSKAENPELKALLNVEYGDNAVSILVSENFSGDTQGLTQMPGTWIELLNANSIVTELGVDKELTVDLSVLGGKKNVYVGLKYASVTTTSTHTNIIKNISITRDVPQGIEEILPTIVFSRTNEGIDFFNLSANPASLSKWSIRTGYAKATIDDDIWLIMRPFDLTNAADAFFSFESKLLNSTYGPYGLQIKIYRGEYSSGTNINDLVWEEYSTSRVDHRINPLDYFSSGKLDLSDYCGEIVSVAFRYANTKGEQYEIKNFQMFNLPDVEAPVLNVCELDKLVYNKVRFKLNANENAIVYYGLYDGLAGIPTFDDLKNGVGSLLSGSYDYLQSGADEIYTVTGLSSETNYKLMVGLEDGSGNQSVINELVFTTPLADFDPPAINVDFENIENHSLQAIFSATEACTYYYYFQKKALGNVDKTFIQVNGEVVEYENGLETVDFYSLDKSTEYSLFVYGVDVAENESDIFVFNVTTLNKDLTPPVFISYGLSSVNNWGFNLTLNLTEKSTVFYAVQIMRELPPSYSGIESGERSVSFGNLEYLIENQEQVFQIMDLKSGTDYVVYLYGQDAAGNLSDIRYIVFTTTKDGIPLISRLNNERIYIDIETSYDLSLIPLEYTGIPSIDDFARIIHPGEHYTVDGTMIIPDDDFDGRLLVPLTIQKGNVKSNALNIEFVVGEERVASKFADMMEVMVGNNLNGVPDKDAAIALIEMQQDGSFFDKLSSNSPDYCDYMTMVLGGRLKNIANEYYLEKYRRRKRTEVRHKLYKAIEFWIDHKPVWQMKEASSSWPESMGAIILPLYQDMEAEYLEDPLMRGTIERLKSKILAFNKWCWNTPEGSEAFQPYQGNNLSARLWGSMAMAAFTNSVSDAFIVYDALMEDLVFKINDSNNSPAGWKPDGSYHMNNLSGGQWNWYEYGVAWLEDVLEYSELARRTPWRIPGERYQLMGDVLINGAQWLNWYDFIPYNITGKHATRLGQRSNKSQVLNLFNKVRYEAFVNNYLLDNNDEILNAYEDMDREFSSIDSSKYFWNSNIMLHDGGLYNISLAMPSIRTGTPEAGIDSIYGIVNHHMGDGTCLVFNSDYNYRQRRYWNYKRLPGTTIEQNTLDLPLNIGGNNGRSLNEFAGGISNGSYGVASFYYDRDGAGNVNGFKSYFFFKEGIVALGTGIKKKNSNRVFKVLTSIEQDVLSSDIDFNTAGDVINKISVSTLEYNKEFTLNQPAWIHHNNNGYFILPQVGGDKLNIGIDEQAGAWDEINGTWRWEIDNPNYIMRYDSAAVMQISIDHLKEPTKAKYAYMVFPNRSINSFKGLIDNNPIQLVSNSDTVQVVWHMNDKVAGLVFFKGDTAIVNDELSVVSDKPLIMLVKENESGEFEAWLSDPYQREEVVDIKFLIHRKNEMPVDIQRLVVLPRGLLKGKAVYTSTGDIWSQIPPIILDEEIADGNENIDESSDHNIQDQNKKLSIGVYPTVIRKNDAFTVNCNLEKAGVTNVEIISISGKILYKSSNYLGKGNNKIQVSCSNLDQGIYVVKITIAKEVETRKIIIR